MSFCAERGRDMEKIILETERLILREMTPADRPALCGILQDGAVMYAYEHPFSDEEVDSWLANQLRRYKEDGFGLWAAVLRQGGEMIGQCGLTLQDIGGAAPVPEIGYLFRRSHWRRGYATEAALACRDYAFRVLGLPAVYSIIRESNAPSVAVALRVGMTPEGELVKHYYGLEMPHLIFRCENPAESAESLESTGDL